MAIEVKSAFPDDFERILPLLRHFEKGTPHLDERRWRRLFDSPWPTPDDTRGFMLLDGNRPVGFEAFIQHSESISGKDHIIAHGSSWVVVPEYRKHSMKLRLPWIEREEAGGITTVGMTARPELQSFMLACGHQILDTHQFVLLPGSSFSRSGWRSCGDEAAAIASMPAHDQFVYYSHFSLDCHNLILKRNGETLYLVYTIRPLVRGRPTAQLLYSSNPELLSSALATIQLALLGRHRILFLVVDERLLPRRTSFRAKRTSLSSPRIYRSEALPPTAVSNLFSEFVLLDIE